MSALPVADVLERAADRLSKPGAWTVGVSATDADGVVVRPYSLKAVCWCMEGAIAAETRHGWLTDAFRREPAFRFLSDFIVASGFNGTPYRFNDSSGRTQAEVVAKLREAAKAARGEA